MGRGLAVVEGPWAEQVRRFLALVLLPAAAGLVLQVPVPGSFVRSVPSSLGPSAAGMLVAGEFGRGPERRGGACEGGGGGGYVGAPVGLVAVSWVEAVCGRDWSEAAGLPGRVVARL